jgi:type II secretory pathway pseudopilin PulG
MVDINIKKAAMFGLDARIALAIFGALSVISGAALYSAIQNSKAVRVILDMKEIGKAYEQYILDTGASLDRVVASNSSTSYYWYKTDKLISDTKTGWKGPYLNYSTDTDDLAYLVYNDTQGAGVLELRTDASWGGSSYVWNDGVCVSGTDCAIWVTINTFDNLELANNIDKIIDNSDGLDVGDFRIEGAGDGRYKYSYYLKFLAVKNPND